LRWLNKPAARARYQCSASRRDAAAREKAKQVFATLFGKLDAARTASK